MRVNLCSNLLQGTASATEGAIRDLPHELPLKGQLARLLRYGEEFVNLVLGLDYLNEVNNPTEGFGDVAMLTKFDINISDAANATMSIETTDLHDLTGHHRYYGSAA